MPEMEKLLAKAEAFAATGTDIPISSVYRNQSRAYFENISENENIMKKRIKDGSGDPRSPINGIISGLFFGARLVGGSMPDKSPFGTSRVVVDLGHLFSEGLRIYFADFYCLGRTSKNHYIILTIAKENSDEDRYFSAHLPRLNLHKNSFFFRKGHDFFYRHCERLWPELFFTFDMDITHCQLQHNIELFLTKSQGIKQKTKDCPLCNI